MEQLEAGAPSWRILRYQRIVDPKDLPFPIAEKSFITPKTFEMHLRYLLRNNTIIRLSDLTETLLRAEKVPDNAVVITIDGGHSDAFINGLPLLLQYNTPATFFVAPHFIESMSFSFDDRLALALLVMQKEGIPLPIFEGLSPDVYELIKRYSPELKITPEAIALITAELRTTHYQIRSAFLASLLASTLSIMPFPHFEDFIRWDDVTLACEKGFSFGILGHYNIPAPCMDEKMIFESIYLALDEFMKREITVDKCFCLPEGAVSAEVLRVLSQCQVQFALTLGLTPEPRFQTSLPMLLGRVAMFESSSFTEEAFWCRLHGIVASGVEF
jgi:hypothetical protein